MLCPKCNQEMSNLFYLTSFFCSYCEGDKKKVEDNDTVYLLVHSNIDMYAEKGIPNGAVVFNCTQQIAFSLIIYHLRRNLPDQTVINIYSIPRSEITISQDEKKYGHYTDFKGRSVDGIMDNDDYVCTKELVKHVGSCLISGVKIIPDIWAHSPKPAWIK